MTTFSAYLLDFIKEGSPEWEYCKSIRVVMLCLEDRKQ